MSDPNIYTPGGTHTAPDSESDARNRAARTFVQGLATDVVVAGALVVTEVVGSGEDVDWRLLAAALVKTALMTGAAYVYRKLRPPA